MNTFDELHRALIALQEGRCGICGDPHEVIDHDHASGMVRGLLCRRCNRNEGDHGDGCHPTWICPICSWRSRPAVSWIGWTTLYISPRLGVAIDAPQGKWVPTSVTVARDEADQLRAAMAIDAILRPPTQP